MSNLSNVVRGHRSLEHGRVEFDELVSMYQQRSVQIQEPSLLIRINKLYHPRMSSQELYDITRSACKIGPRREGAELAFAVFEGIIREVYEISHWLPAGSTFSSRNGRGSVGTVDGSSWAGLLRRGSVASISTGTWATTSEPEHRIPWLM